MINVLMAGAILGGTAAAICGILVGMEKTSPILQLNTLGESAPATAQTGSSLDVQRQVVCLRIICSIFLCVLCPLVCLFCSALDCCRGELYGDYVYGDDFPFTPLFMELCFPTVLGLSVFFANFRFARPKRFVREAIAWLLLLYMAFVLHCLAAYLFFGDGMAVAAVVRGFCKRIMHFSFIMSVSILFMLGFCLHVWLCRWMLKLVQAKMAKRGKLAQVPSLVRKLNGFINTYPARIVMGEKECVCNFARCAIWGTLLSLLILESMIAFCFAMNTQPPMEMSDSANEPSDPAYEPSFELGSFKGEKFGSALSDDVVRKKLDEPIGVIDELMFQAKGNRERLLVCAYGHKYLGNISDVEADKVAEETCASLQKLIGFELRRVPLGTRDGFRKAVHSPMAYAVVKWDDHFFQKEKVLRLEVGLNVNEWHNPNLKATEVMGYKIGEPVGGNGIPRTPFWKFERIVNQCSSNGIADGVYAVHDVSGLSREDAVREFEDARTAVEELHGIKMFKTVDGDFVKQYDCYGSDVHALVKLEYLREKQIRYAVLSTGDWLQRIHSIPRPKAVTQSCGRDMLVFSLCVAVVIACGARLLYLVRRNRKERMKA